MWYILDKNKNVVGNINSGTPKGMALLRDSWKGQLTDGYTTLEFDVPTTHEDSKHLVTGAFVVYTDNVEGYELFRVVKATTPSGDDIVKTIMCETAATQDLAASHVDDKSFSGVNLATIVQYLLGFTRWQLGECFYNELVTIEFKDYPTVLEAIRTLVTQIGGEIEFKVIFDRRSLNISQMVVNIYEKRGTDSGVSFEYRRNLRGLRKIEDGNKVVTAMIGIASQQDANGNKIRLSNAQKALPEGFEVVGEKIVDLNALAEYGNNGQNIEEKFIDQNATNSVELLDNTFNALLKVNKPIVSWEAEALFLEQVKGYDHTTSSIGDYVLIKDFTSSPAQFLKCRILNKEKSVTNPLNGSVVFGEYQIIEVLPIEDVERLKQTLSLKEQQWNQAIEDAKNAKDDAAAANKKPVVQVLGVEQFNNGVGSNLYKAAVFIQGQEVDLDGTQYFYLWQMYDNTNIKIEGYERSGKTLTLSATEFNKRTRLECIVKEMPETITEV